MRICDLTTLWIDGGTGGGVNTYLAEKARYLAQRGGTEHVIVVPGERTRKQRLYGSTLYTIKSPRLPANPPHRVLWNLSAVTKILQDELPSVVEVDCAYLLGKVAADALRSRNVPVVGFYHVHHFAYALIQRLLLEQPAELIGLPVLEGALVNSVVGVLVFVLLDRFRQST